MTIRKKISQALDRIKEGGLLHSEAIDLIFDALAEPSEMMLFKGCERGVAFDVLLDDERFSGERAIYTTMIAEAKAGR